MKKSLILVLTLILVFSLTMKAFCEAEKVAKSAAAPVNSTSAVNNNVKLPPLIPKTSKTVKTNNIAEKPVKKDLKVSNEIKEKETKSEQKFVPKSPAGEVQLFVKEENKIKINRPEPIKKIDGKLFNSKEELMSQYMQVQKKMDVEDINILWDSTVERNPVIKFAVKKLSAPPEQRRVNSSLMAKTIGTLISGVSILPGVFGADMFMTSLSSAGGTLASRAIRAGSMPKEVPLTDTELIHLAKLVEDLQDKVIKNYYQYKSGLESLKIARQEVTKQNINHSVALRANDKLAVITSKAMYDNALREQLLSRQKVKTSRLELLRLAGDDTLNALRLGKVKAPDSKALPSILPPVPNAKINVYTDKNITELANETGNELKNEQEDMVADLSILWNAAVERSETIRFAIMKLSNPDGKIEKVDMIKKIFSPVIGAASMVGVGAGNAATATSAILGGGLLSSVLSNENAEFNAQLSKVTDTDLILLAQETENLQQKLVNLYCDYAGALESLQYADKIVINRQKSFEYTKNNPELLAVANVFYKDSLAEQYKARENMLSKRVALEQFVGNEALLMIDKSIKQRVSMSQILYTK